MNLVAGALLSELPEPEAFNLLCVVAERRMPEHYDPAMVGPQVDAEVFPEVVAMFCPRVAEAVRKTGMDIAMLATPWFLSLFLSAVELGVGVRMMDVYWLEGVVGLWWIAVGVLRECEEGIVEAGEWGGVVDVVRRYLATLSDEHEEEHKEAESDALPPLKPTGSRASLPSMPTPPPPRRTKIDSLIRTAYSIAPLVTSELLDSLRARARVKVLRRAREQARKSKSRDLSELSSFSSDEIGMVLDFLDGAEGSSREAPDATLVAGGLWGAALSRFEDGVYGAAPGGVGLLRFKALLERVCPWTVTVKGSTPKRGMTLEQRLYWFAAFRSGEGKAPGSAARPVDANATVTLLDTILRQPSNSKLRLLFDLFDLDANGFLTRDDLAALMETLLAISVRCGATDHNEEDRFMRATAGFLHAAIRVGTRTEADSETTYYEEEDDGEISRSGSPTPSASISVVAARSARDDFALGFGDFTLAVLGQSALVDYFGRVWKMVKGKDGLPELP
jgi:hypothetical protein